MLYRTFDFRALRRWHRFHSHSSLNQRVSRPIFGGLQRNSKDDDIPHTRRWTMKAIVVTDQAAGTAGMKLVERPEPQGAVNDGVGQVEAAGFVGTELAWPSTWTDRLDRDRTPSIPGHELAGVVTALGYGTTGL